MQDRNCLILVFLSRESKKLRYCGILYENPQIFPNKKFRPKIKLLKFGTKITLIKYFGLEFQKAISYLKSASSNLLTCKVSFKNKSFKLGSKILYLGLFGLQFNKNYYQIFDQHCRICGNIKLHPKQKNCSWDQKCSIWDFGPEC